MQQTNRRAATSKGLPFCLAGLCLLGLSACDLKGDPVAYLRRGLLSAEPASSANVPTASAPVAASVPGPPAREPVASASPARPSPSARSQPVPHSYSAPPVAEQSRGGAALRPAEVPAEQARGAVVAAPSALSGLPAQAMATPSALPPVASAAGGKRNVSIGGAAVAGGNVGNAARVVAALRAPLRACYSAATSSGPGALRFAVGIGKTGAVTSVGAQRSGELSSDLVACAVGVVKAAKFEPPENGAATLQVSATFVVQ